MMAMCVHQSAISTRNYDGLPFASFVERVVVSAGSTLLSNSSNARVGLVVIGRNEGARLKRCLRSIPVNCPTIYVDSGSSDGSVDFAESCGFLIERLDSERGFTAALARNAGWERLLATYPLLDYIQFIDGDCELNGEWIDLALTEMDKDGSLCAVFGRRRERFPNASSYNALCDDEWNVPIGFVEACGGDVMFRVEPLQLSGGYSETLIAGEEPDLCLRLGQRGWRIRRIDAEMTLHDANIHSAGQHWRRARRAGFAFAEHVARHGSKAFRSWRRQRDAILAWGLVFPVGIGATIILAMFTGASWLLYLAALGMLLYPIQFVRIVRAKQRTGTSFSFARIYAFWMVAGRFAQLGGLLRYYYRQLRGARPRIIEYRR